MTSAQVKKLKAQLAEDYEKARFGVIKGNSFPDLDDLARDQAVHLQNVAYGFIDIRGYTKWSTQNNQMTVFRVIEPTLKLFTRIVRMHNGTVEKTTGDGLMFIMGADKTDAAEVSNCTLQCALDIMTAGDQIVNPLLKQKRQLASQLRYGMGIAMGDALVAKIGIRGHYMLSSISRAANYAAKLEDRAGENEILLDDSLYEATAEPVRQSHLERRGELLGAPYYAFKPKLSDVLNFCDCFKLSLE